MGNRPFRLINYYEPTILANPIMHRTEISRAEVQAEYYNQRLNEAVNDIMQNAQLRDIFQIINNYPL